MTTPIPGPRALPLIGNLLDVWNDRDMPLRGLERLADAHGPIYQVWLNGKRRIVCSSAELMEELTDERRFVKVPPPTLSQTPGPKGLFTAPSTDDPDWGQAHRILMPAFAPLSVRDMFPDMRDIANQLVLSWARKETKILLTEDFTRLTLDTIALCTMSHRFNSFYSDTANPFVEAMMVVFKENTARATRPSLATKLMFKANTQRAEAAAVMNKIGRAIVDNRRAHPTDARDVLNTMIYGEDPKTGEVMRDELVIQEMITFLIAGHETTSGLLSFAVAHLLKNPHTYLKAQKEVDEVVGTRAIEADDIKNLKYLNAVLRETARLTPTVPVLQKKVSPDISHSPVVIGGGEYQIEPDDHIVILVGKSQKDPKVWGETADEFDPDRMCDENFDRVMAEFPGSWKPFGNGKRACIGRPFAWQESMLVLAMVLQSFDVRLDDPAYTIKVKQALTIKPDDLYIRVSRRRNMDATAIDRVIHSSNNAAISGHNHLETPTSSPSPHPATCATTTTDKRTMTVLYGSNTGTCQAFAQRLASAAESRGFDCKVTDLDSATASVPKESPVMIITSSYEGQPPDNASRFVAWLQNCKEGSLDRVEYTVFGCGHRDWSRTFHRIPKLVDQLMSNCGATLIAPAGYADAARGNLYGDFEDWLDIFWAAESVRSTPSSNNTQLQKDQLQEDFGGTTMDIDISTDARASSLRYDVSLATVTENRVLTGPGEQQIKCHMEVELPPGTTYECGDYLAVLPLNSEKNVRRIMAHFGLPWDAVVTVKATGSSTIPANVPLSVFDVLRSYVELSQPATKKNLKTLARYTKDAKVKAELEDLSNNDTHFEVEILDKRTSIFSLLTRRNHDDDPTPSSASIKLPFGEFLAILPPLHVRQYSISSSPLFLASNSLDNGSTETVCCSITYGVIDTQALSDPEQRFEGVAGHYLRSLNKGDAIQVRVRPGGSGGASRDVGKENGSGPGVRPAFRMPLDPETTPLLMFAAGTGLAPFRGFIQQRAIRMRSNPNRKLARAVLFLGCRTPTGDRLYADEMDAWAEAGVVEVRYAFSKDKEASQDCAHVPDRMLLDADDIVALWRDNARVYVCGSRQFQQGVRDAAHEIASMVVRRRESKPDLGGNGGDEEDMKTMVSDTDMETTKMEEVIRLFRQALQERVASDVFD